MNLFESSFDQVEIGTELGPVFHDVTPEMVRKFGEGTGDRHPWHDDGAAPYEEAIAHPAMATIFSTALLGRSGKERQSGGIHVKQQFRFLAPLRVGQKVATTGTVLEKFIFNDRKTIVLGTVSTDETGLEIVRCQATLVFPE